ncbi:hypothetical protein EVAR_5456_1 [Eumeta japonica]|uniref:Uncharacterized protein n=1 Tax=Eumeta variegata TaxID=151549 RepID=A0A4C1T9R4_EUMVA|nr:hypothetical protein EVAR_5456_1 [Eumeta japonica]
MACRRECHEDGRPFDRPIACHAIKAETPRTEGGMANQGAILGRTNRSLMVYMFHLSGHAQVEHVNHQSRAARSMLRPVLRSHLPLRAKVALYKGYIRSRLTYAAPAWYALCSASQRKRIQAQQNIALRMIVGAGRALLAGCSTSLTKAPMNSFRTSHQRKRGRRAADPSLENYSKHLLPNTRTRLIKKTYMQWTPRKGTTA